MDATPLEIVIEVKPMQLVKALSPIAVTVSGIVIDFKDEQP